MTHPLPRTPAGEPEGGQFADEGGGSGGGSGGGVHRLGDLSKTYESGNSGPGTVSSGKNDPGGVSYGTYQLSTRYKVPQEFLDSPEGRRWAAEFGNAIPGSKAFSDKWQEIAKRDPSTFDAAQHAFIKRTHYDVQVAKIEKETGLDINRHSSTLRDVIWSTAVQAGPRRSIVVEAVRKVGRPSGDPSATYDGRLIERIYVERTIHYPATRSRFEKEVVDARRRLDQEIRR